MSRSGTHETTTDVLSFGTTFNLLIFSGTGDEFENKAELERLIEIH